MTISDECRAELLRMLDDQRRAVAALERMLGVISERDYRLEELAKELRRLEDLHAIPSWKSDPFSDGKSQGYADAAELLEALLKPVEVKP